MAGIAHKIMVRIRGRGARVHCAKDFLDLGSRAAVDQALSRLCKSGMLRRVSRGLYDCPRRSSILDQPAPVNVDAVVDALKRRANVTVVPGNLAAANALGLTNAVPTKPDFVASRPLSAMKVGGRTLTFKPAGAVLGPWLGSPATTIVQAFIWLHDAGADRLDKAVATLRHNASADAKRALAKGIHTLPGWAIPAARQIVANHATKLA